ncbi:ATP-dependent helicase [Halalkalibacillus sediminis]|uniref:ATP-dependent helicase n=1 Tax=Halalkalibacillus sediminis TaxID=2018042 RepID=A0A2I0QXE3_9BACI|nr:SNF2-related protein [Halalkalibacillus sediminis]PKR78978.1 ATP-dependent helicase [Halalkalibacillus sediminis]
MKTLIIKNEIEQFSQQHNTYQTCEWKLFQQAYQIAQLKSSRKNQLISLNFLPDLNLMSHQLEAVNKVIFEMHGRAILADEVGLGKTVEAGVITKELMIKGLVKKVLILVPSSLINQWVEELNRMFFIPAASKHRSYNWADYDVVVSSIDLAKKEPHSKDILEQQYDLLIVDEAHRLKNPKTKNYQFVKSIQSTYCLLLTATPIQNKIEEVYYLMSIVRPGLLGNKTRFKELVRKSNKEDRNQSIQTLIQQSMIRNRREETEHPWTDRHVQTISIDFTPEEISFYERLTSFSQEHALTNLTLQREFCSSREACFQSIRKQPLTKETILQWVELLEQLPHHSKALRTIQLIKEIGEKCIIFTEYKSTQIYLQWLFKQYDIAAVTYNGDFKKSKKQWMLRLFENQADVLIATDAGAEGLNLQFCNHMIHYDLPWNPMKLEQRIGRIHRYGQQNDVHIYYIVLNQTTDQRIMNLLYKKLDVFRDVIGEIDQILTELNIESLEKELGEIISEASSEKESEIKIDNMIEVITSNADKRSNYHESS